MTLDDLESEIEQELRDMRQAYYATLAKMEEAKVERAAEALALSWGVDFANLSPGSQSSYREDVRTVLRAAREV